MIDVVYPVSSELAEGPVWDEESGRLWWVNIFAGEVHCLDPSTGADEVWQFSGPVGSIALCQAGGLLVALKDGIYHFAPDTRALTAIVRPERERQWNRFNDGKTDRRGRFWVGSLHLDESEPTGALYCLDEQNRCRRVVDGIYASNGLAFSPDGRVGYHADSQRRVVWRFEVDERGFVEASRRVFLELEPGVGAPDGAAVDVDGCYWLAHAGGGRLVRYTPRGDVDRVVHLPVQIPTCVAFAGERSDILYVTSATVGMDPAKLSPEAMEGCILAVRVGVGGLPDARFAGPVQGGDGDEA